MESTPTGAFLFIAILIIMLSNKNFSNEVPATLQDVIYESAFGGAHIRMQMIDGEPWFVAKDVAFALDITWSGHTLDAIPEDWKGMVNLTTPSSGERGGGTQTLTVINEAALYKLAFRSNKPEADRFVNWVAGTLLPTLRKTGRYEIGTTKRKRLLPRDRKDIAPGFFAEVKKYILPKDEREVAQSYGCTLKHVQKVLAGTTPSYPIMEILVGIAADNRTKGILRPVAHRYTQLVLQFTEVEPNVKED